MAEHKIVIQNRIAIADAGIELVCNNPTDTIRFEFDEEWNGHAAKTARFSCEGKYIDVPFSGNTVTVPEIYQTHYVYIGVFADGITSTAAKVNARYSIKCYGGKVVEPTEDVYNQIITLINAGIDANDGVGVSSAYVNDAGHLIIILTTGTSIDCGMVKGENGKDGAGAEEYASVLSSISALESRAETLEKGVDDLENYAKRPFELNGNPVQLDNYEGMPLNVITTLEPIQAGSGEPSPDNIRTISGWTGAKLNHTNGSGLEHTYSADFGQTVYGGTLDWQTGVLTVDRAFYTFDGSENFKNGGWNNPYSYVRWDLFPDVVKYQMSVVADAYCSHYAVGSVGYVITNEIAGFGIYDRGHMIFSSPTHTTVDAFKAYLAAQYAAGTPVQVCYKLATPQTIQLTPQEILALQGVNTLYGDGTLNVSGRKDILWLTSRLIERIKTLESAIISMGGNI